MKEFFLWVEPYNKKTKVRKKEANGDRDGRERREMKQIFQLLSKKTKKKPLTLTKLAISYKGQLTNYTYYFQEYKKNQIQQKK